MSRVASRVALRAGVFGALSLARVDALLLRWTALKGRTLILNLHRISPEKNPFWPALDPALFDDMLRFLSKRAHLRGLRDEPGHDRSKPDVVLSFDDGYADFVEHAMPILARYRVRANQNLIPTCVDTGEPPWNVVITDFLRAAPPSLLAEIRLPEFHAPVPDTDDDVAKARFGAALSAYLKMRPRSERAPLWEELRGVMDRADARPTRMMRLAEVKQAAREHDLGAHSWHHDSMGFENDAYLRDDVERCKRWFSEALGLELDIYAFPNGSYRGTQADLVRSQGIKYVLLVDERVAAPRDTALPRLSVGGMTRGETRLRASGIPPFRKWQGRTEP